MKKIYNIIIFILIVAILAVAVVLIIKYTSNYLNEREVKEVILNIEEKLNNLNDKNNVNIIDNKKNINNLSNKYDLNNTENKEIALTKYKEYEVEGIVEIPKINIKYPILNKTDESSMKLSITKLYGEKVNEIGNYTIVGHNNKDGTMFGKIKYLEMGDSIKLTNLANKAVEYKVFKTYNIKPNDLSCVDSIEPQTKEITLITCTNGHKSRLVVKARENK